LIVIDDQSKDQSTQVAGRWLKDNQARFSHAILAQTETKSGFGQLRNVGFALAEARYVFVLDADNVAMDPACLEECLITMRNSTASAAYPTIRQYGESRESGHYSGRAALSATQGDYIGVTALINRSAWRAVGGYDSSLPSREGSDFWRKFVERGLHLIRVPKELARYREPLRRERP
jgi:glycosyltransferase involved in cell wall biosynthesis